MSVVFDRPIRDIAARFGSQTNCAGTAKILADIEPAGQFEFLDAHDGAETAACDDELIGRCVAAVHRGVIAELSRLGQDELPALRFVLRRIQVHPLDSTESGHETVGRTAVIEALHRLTRSH